MNDKNDIYDTNRPQENYSGPAGAGCSAPDYSAPASAAPAVSALPQASDELELDLRDMLASLLLRWKTVLLFFLIAAVLGCGYAMVRNSRSSGAEGVTDEDVAEARLELAENKASDAERLFFQYVAYQELQRDLTAYYSEFVSTQRGMDEDSVVQMRRKYYVTSDIENLGNLLQTFALTEAEYDALRAISPDDEAGARIYDRVSISSWDSSRITVSNLQGEEQAPIQYLFTISLYGNSEQQCEEMMAIVDAAFHAQLDDLRVLDPDLETRFTGDDFNYNMLSYVTNLRKSYIDRITNADTEITNLNNRVSKLDSDEQKYYNLLKQQYEESLTQSDSGSVSWKKWTLIGGVLGIFLGAVVVLWPYLFDGKVKTSDELEYLLRAMVLNRVTVPGKKNLFGRWCASLTGADDVDAAVKADMIAADLSILMEKSGRQRLCLLCDSADPNAAALASQVQVRLQEKRPGAAVSVANPVASTAELAALGSADLGVVVAEVKQTRRETLRRWSELCARYALPLAGSVAVQKCW